MMWKLDFWEMIIRVTISFIVLLVLARILGKEQSFMQKLKLMEVYMLIAELVKIIDKSVIKQWKPFYDALNNRIIYCLTSSLTVVTPVAIAASLTARVTTSATRSSKGTGMMKSSCNSASSTREAIA